MCNERGGGKTGGGGGGGSTATGGGGSASLEDAHNDVYNSLSAKEQDSIIDYTTSQYQGINGYLLGNGKADAKTMETIKNVDSALAKSTVPVDTVAYRGISSDGYKAMKSSGMLDKGAVFEHKNYMSTTTDKGIANNFSRGAKGTKSDPNNVLHVKVPKGKKGLYLGNNSNINEKELLLPRGVKLKTVGERMESTKVKTRGLGGKTVTKTQWTRITEVEVI